MPVKQELSAKTRSRLTVDLPCALDKRLDQLAKELGVTKADLLRDAVRLLSEYDAIRREGFTAGGWKEREDGSRDTVRIAIGI